MANEKDGNKPVLELVAGAKKNAGKKSSKPSSADAEKAGSIAALFGSYAIVDGAFHQRGKDNEVGKPTFFALCDFTCRIVEELISDDGLTESSLLKIEGVRKDGKTLPAVDVPIKAFTSGNWIHDAWGMLPFVFPGATKKEHLKAAIQMYSRTFGEIPRRTVYGMTGWKFIDGQWGYLSGSGMITKDGLTDSVQVDLEEGHMKHYQLPAPLAGGELKHAFDDALALLTVCPDKPYIGAVLLAALARAPLGECHPVDFVIWLQGFTGSRKSSLTGVILAFFGKAFNGKRMPSNWNDSRTDIEIKAHKAKDTVFVVDDFKPGVVQSRANELHSAANHIVTNTGNQSSSGRRNVDHSKKADRFNRSMMIVTAEDLLKGSQSSIGRLVVQEIAQKDVDLAVLSGLQKSAKEGRLAGLMATYLQWIAGRMDQLKQSFPDMVEHLRDDAERKQYFSSHPRAPESYANLVAAVEMFLDFLESSGALSSERACILQSELETLLQTAIRTQSTYQAEEDESERFMQLLRAVLSSGDGHIGNSLDQGPPTTKPFAWGWRESMTDAGKQYTPMGSLLGWYRTDKDGGADEVWLDPATAYKAVQHFGRIQGDIILMKQATLWRRMAERGLIKETIVEKSTGRLRTSINRTVCGRQVRVLVFDANKVMPTEYIEE